VELVCWWQLHPNGLLKVADDVKPSEGWGKVYLPHRPIWTLRVIGYFVPPSYRLYHACKWIVVWWWLIKTAD